MTKSPLVSIIIANYNLPELLEKLMVSIDQYMNKVSKEVIIVDNHSQKENLDQLREQYSFIKIIKLEQNLGFGRAQNIGAQHAKGEILFFLNSDTEFFDTSIHDTFLKFYETHGKNLWGIRLLWPDFSFQNSFSRDITFLDFILIYWDIGLCMRWLPFVHRRWQYHKYFYQDPKALMEVDIMYATAILIFKKDFLALQGFDDRYFMYFEDIDLCERFKGQLGGKIFCCPDTSIIHRVQGGKNNNKKKSNRIYKKSRFIYGVKKFGIISMFMIFFINYLFFLIIEILKFFKRNFHT